MLFFSIMEDINRHRHFLDDPTNGGGGSSSANPSSGDTVNCPTETDINGKCCGEGYHRGPNGGCIAGAPGAAANSATDCPTETDVNGKCCGQGYHRGPNGGCIAGEPAAGGAASTASCPTETDVNGKCCGQGYHRGPNGGCVKDDASTSSELSSLEWIEEPSTNLLVFEALRLVILANIKMKVADVYPIQGAPRRAMDVQAARRKTRVANAVRQKR